MEEVNIYGTGHENSGYMYDINVEYYTTCAALSIGDCVCIRRPYFDISTETYDGYNDSDVVTYSSKSLTFQTSRDKPPSNYEHSRKCYIGSECRDITDMDLCSTTSQCEYKDRKCRSKCEDHDTKYDCKSDDSCWYDNNNQYCTNSSLFLVFNLLSIIMISLFLI